MTDLIQELAAADADVIMLVSNPLEGVVAVRSMAKRPEQERLPIISHWGIIGAGKSFFERVREDLSEVDLVFLQTFSFINPPFPDRADRVVDSYCVKFPDCQSARDIFSAVGTAHAYELLHLLALAVEQAGTIDRPVVRDALENLGAYEGLIRNYNPPFTPDDHDALTAADFRIAGFDKDGAIIPVSRVDN